jgi:hypothetical protein
MPSLNQFRQANPALRAFVCLLLVISFLYNPYVRAHVSSGELNVQHPFSNRATVGASELEKYAPVVSETAHVVIALGLPVAFLAIATSDYQVQSIALQRPTHAQVAWAGSVWSRPPPAV